MFNLIETNRFRDFTDSVDFLHQIEDKNDPQRIKYKQDKNLAKFDDDLLLNLDEEEDDLQTAELTKEILQLENETSGLAAKHTDQKHKKTTQKPSSKSSKSTAKRKNTPSALVTSQSLAGTSSNAHKQTHNLSEMVKDMATFKWPDSIKKSASANVEQSNIKTYDQTNLPVSTTAPIAAKIEKNEQDQSKPLQETVKKTEIVEEPQMPVGATVCEAKPKQLKFETEVTKIDSDEKRSGRVVSKSRSPSCARSYSGETSRFRSATRASGGALSNTTSFISSRAASTSTAASRSSSRSGSVKIVNILGKEIIKLPSFLEREIKIKKNFDRLGIAKVDCSIDEGMNGCAILKIDQNSACAKDGRLKTGDYLLSVNNEQMRNLSNSSAKAILNRASLISNDVV